MIDQQFETVTHAIIDELDKLATKGSPRQIADFLAARKVTGHHSSTSCPVHTYIQRVAKKTQFLVMTYGTVIKDDLGMRFIRVANPLAISDFIHHFDRSLFPELERRS
jgi:hypothetical protein